MTVQSALLSPSTVVGVLVGTGLAVGVLVYLDRPAVDRTVVLASLPWIAAGVALTALRGMVGYPEPLAVLLGFPWAYLLAGTLGGLVWVFVASVVDRRGARPHYFGVAGFGTLFALTAALVVRGAVIAPVVLAVWLAVPLVAALATAVVLVGLGLWLPDAGYFADAAGAVVIFGLVLDGTGTALAFGFGNRIASPLRFPVGVIDPLLGGGAHPLAVAWAVVLVRLALGVAVLLGLTALDRTRPAAAERGLELATVLTAVVAANTFLFALGGWFA